MPEKTLTTVYRITKLIDNMEEQLKHGNIKSLFAYLIRMREDVNTVQKALKSQEEEQERQKSGSTHGYLTSP